MRPPRGTKVAPLGAVAAILIGIGGCDRPGPAGSTGTSSTAAPTGTLATPAGSDSAAPGAATTTASASAAAPPPAPARDHATLIAAGDVCLGRLVGQEVIKNPSFNPFESTATLLASADIRFVNLESQLSDQKGETQSPTQKLVFTGPPGGAHALALGKIDVVSAANNHMWDYGQSAFLQTLDNLEREGIAYAGAGRSRERAYAPEIVDAGGFRVAFLAFTDIWNQGVLRLHPARDHVAEAGREAIVAGVRAARARDDVDAVVVSYHGGEEYVHAPLQRAVDLHHAAIDAGADAVLAHHPHVTQGIELYQGKPIFYSLGNYLMRTHRDHAETEIGFFARITLSKHAAPEAWVCPFHIVGLVPKAIPLAEDPRAELYERVFRQRLRVIQGAIVGPATLGPTGADGCARVEAGAARATPTR